MLKPIYRWVLTERTNFIFDPHDISGQEDKAEKEDGKLHDEKEGLKSWKDDNWE